MDVFRKGKFELLALMETNLKGNGEVLWCGVNGIIAGVQEMKRAREGVAVLLNDVCHIVVTVFGCVSSRILWIKFSSQVFKFVWWWGTPPMKELVKKGKRFWNDSYRTVNRVGNGRP